MGSKPRTWMAICYSIHDKKVVDFARYGNKSNACSILRQMADDKLHSIKRTYKGNDIVFNANDDNSSASISWCNGEKEFVWEVIDIASGKRHKLRNEYANKTRDKKRKHGKEYYNRICKTTVGMVSDMYDEYKLAGNSDVMFSYYNEKSKKVESVEVDMSDDRYANFFEHGTICEKCGLKGEYFWLETCGYGKKNKYSKPHFNLYGMRNGKEIMLTKDHIKSRSNGGKDDLDNYQCLCKHCNEHKGSMSNEEFMA